MFDKFISISDETAKEWREGYEDRMDKEKAKADKAKQDREGKQIGLDLIFGVPDFCESAFRPIASRRDTDATVPSRRWIALSQRSASSEQWPRWM